MHFAGRREFCIEQRLI
ncbi:hypothetical protein ACNVD4_00040, partial [Rhizobium sp. BR5]